MAELPVHQPAWIETAPVRIRSDRRIAASRAAVWERVAAHETWPEWFTALSTVRVTGGATGVGGRREVSMPGITVGEVFTVWEPERQFAFAVVQANRTIAGMAESVELRDDPDGCVVTYRQGLEPGRGFGWFWKLTLPRLRKQLSKALDQLAESVEAG